MKKESFFESTVYRVYACTNKKCGCKIACTEKVKDEWKTQCPFCEQETLLLESANLAAPIFIDLTKPKTLGSLGEKNYELAKREGKDVIPQKQGKKPWWRKNKKINFDVLKNPQNYVQTGNT